MVFPSSLEWLGRFSRALVDFEELSFPSMQKRVPGQTSDGTEHGQVWKHAVARPKASDRKGSFGLDTASLSFSFQRNSMLLLEGASGCPKNLSLASGKEGKGHPQI